MAGQSDQKTERWERAARLGCDVIEECRVQLMLKFRFLDLALWHMPIEPIHIEGRYPLATDAKSVYFEPYSELNRFEESFDETVRDYLHLVMHCIFRHPFDEGHKKNHMAWWLACDVLAESVSMEMCGGRFSSPDDVRRKEVLSDLRMRTGALVPTRLYALFDKVFTESRSTARRDLTLDKLIEMQALFERDNHEAWPGYAEKETEEKPGPPEELGEQDEAADEQASSDDSTQQLEQSSGVDSEADADADRDAGRQSGDEEGSAAEGGDEEGDESSASSQGETQEISDDSEGQSGSEDAPEQVPDDRSKDEREWEEISKQIEMNLETFSKEWGKEAQGLIANLEVSNRKVYNYTDFLRRFSTIAEDIKSNDDEYDYIFYTYGLNLYGNMPLVEPLEYMETHRVRDFVIAIDTSGSCRDDLVKRFVQHTFEILRESEGFHGGKVNIHIIQCDAKVQADTKITKMEDLESCMENFFVRGFGGTDFRPVFDYVDDLRNEGELEDLRGLIYFTDGLGYFPSSPPDYDAAFVFMDNGDLKLPPVPPWAMKVVIDEEGIRKLKSSEKFV